MSTILDSLKKSSDQRNNSDKGSLDRFNFGNGKESSSAFSKIIVVLFIALLLAGSFWVYQNYFVSDVDDTSSVEASSEQILEGNKDKTRTESEKLILSNKASKKEKPDSEAIKSQIKKIKEHQEKVLREARLSDLNRNNSSFVKKNEENINDKIKSQRSLVKTNKYKADEHKPKNIQPPIEKKPVPIQKEHKEIAQKPTTPAKQYRFLYQLPFSIRKEVPEIKLNIHVYDEQAENRIAIINGTRFAIDDMITDQILLKDILVNGILLDLNGTEFFIPN